MLNPNRKLVFVYTYTSNLYLLWQSVGIGIYILMGSFCDVYFSAGIYEFQNNFKLAISLVRIIAILKAEVVVK